MPNPLPSSPLTLSVEEWQRIWTTQVESRDEGVNRIIKLRAECEAQAQAADSLQRDHELLQAENTRIQKYAADLEAQLAQAQQERDEARGAQNGNGYAAVVENERANAAEARAFQAEAALEETQKRVALLPAIEEVRDDDGKVSVRACRLCLKRTSMWNGHIGKWQHDKQAEHENDCLWAELQRRRSPTGQEK